MKIIPALILLAPLCAFAGPHSGKVKSLLTHTLTYNANTDSPIGVFVNERVSGLALPGHIGTKLQVGSKFSLSRPKPVDISIYVFAAPEDAAAALLKPAAIYTTHRISYGSLSPFASSKSFS